MKFVNKRVSLALLCGVTAITQLACEGDNTNSTNNKSNNSLTANQYFFDVTTLTPLDPENEAAYAKANPNYALFDKKSLIAFRKYKATVGCYYYRNINGATVETNTDLANCITPQDLNPRVITGSIKVENSNVTSNSISFDVTSYKHQIGNASFVYNDKSSTISLKTNDYINPITNPTVKYAIKNYSITPVDSDTLYDNVPSDQLIPHRDYTVAVNLQCTADNFITDCPDSDYKVLDTIDNQELIGAPKILTDKLIETKKLVNNKLAVIKNLNKTYKNGELSISFMYSPYFANDKNDGFIGLDIKGSTLKIEIPKVVPVYNKVFETSFLGNSTIATAEFQLSPINSSQFDLPDLNGVSNYQQLNQGHYDVSITNTNDCTTNSTNSCTLKLSNKTNFPIPVKLHITKDTGGSAPNDPIKRLRATVITSIYTSTNGTKLTNTGELNSDNFIPGNYGSVINFTSNGSSDGKISLDLVD